MKNYFFRLVLAVLFMAAFPAQAQQVKFPEMLACFNAPEYPACLFEKLDANGFERIDKEYYDNCERVIYFYARNGKPTLFINPMLCRKPYVSEVYPVKIKNELEFQFQKSSRPLFENLSNQIRKQCKPLPDKNGIVPSPKSKVTTRAYLHAATGTTIIISRSQPVAYIYFLK